MRILVVEDEPAVAGFLEQALQESGYAPSIAGSASAAIEAFDASAPDLVVLDVMLPDADGFSVLRSIRTKSSVPVLMLTARDATDDRVKGLDAGADDYLAKPFRLEEFLARVRALLRRGGPSSTIYRISDLELDTATRRVHRAGRLVFLSETEYRLLEILARANGEPVSKNDILREVWGNAGRDPNVVEVYVSYLRTKLDRDSLPTLVQTVRGRGYALRETPAVAA
ncbi:response regulator transcription factor [bacterium]|nr:MAG: response regulator transcription factor [bacterium]